MKKENPLTSIRKACVQGDWKTDARKAWVYGIARGWDAVELYDVQELHGWTNEAVSELRRLHLAYKHAEQALEGKPPPTL